MAGILSGLRVIDCATYIAGPAAATILSDFGAEVIKVERPPSGDPYRHLGSMPAAPKCAHNYHWILDARNRKSIALDLSDAAAHEALLKLVEAADIFITNYQPQVRRRLRLEYKDLEAVNPRLIYASVTGYGETGEDADQPGYDVTAYWARSGLMACIHSEGADPALPPTGFGDHPTSMTLVAAIMLALYQRQTTGRGAKVATTLVANGLWSNACITQAVLCKAEFPERRSRKNAHSPLFNHYATRDAKRILLCLINPAADWKKLCDALGRQDLFDDPRFNSPQARFVNNVALIEILDQEFGARDFADCEATLKRHDLVFAAVPSPMDVVTDAQLEQEGLFPEIAPGLKTIRNPIRVANSEHETPRMPPEIGEHTAEILRSAGYDEEQIAEMNARGCAFTAPGRN
jgi:crotonobetainyl-CoA:carnitine CoA-transferase CaiB-like acyl-CoA transferase